MKGKSKIYFFIALPCILFGQEPIVVKSRFDYATNTTDAVIRFLRCDSSNINSSLTINYTITGDIGNINQTSGNIVLSAGEFSKDLVVQKTGTVIGTETFSVQITSDPSYTYDGGATYSELWEETFIVQEDLPLVAFPGAQGAGAFASGGRGGTVLHVTSLADDGSVGTLRWALQQNYPRIIVFDVSGRIELLSTLGGIYDNFTLAGQTAPQGGITIGGIDYRPYWTNLDNAIIRYVRFESGSVNIPALNLENSRTVILDHCQFSLTHNTSVLSTWDGGVVDGSDQGNITVQWSLFSDALTGHLQGSAPSITGRRSLAGKNSSHHNLFSQISHRFPNVNGSGLFEVVNNVAYSYRTKTTQVYNQSETNYIGNYIRRGPAFKITGGYKLAIGDYLFSYDTISNAPRVYTQGNYWEDLSTGTYDQNYTSWTDVVRYYPLIGREDVQAPEVPYRSVSKYQPLGVPITEYDALSNLDSLIADVGANKYLNEDGTFGVYRDSTLRRNIYDVQNRTVSDCTPCTYQITAPEDYLRFATYPIPTNTRPVGYDTDNDGMPNTWETANGLNNSIDDSSGNDLDPNYTNIEMFINSVDSAVASYGYTVTPTSGLTTTEAGGSDTFTVVLNELPASNVVFDITSNDTGEGTVSASTLTFTTGNWSTPQTITVTGVDDGLTDDNVAYTVTVSVNDASSDDNYDPLADTTVNLNNTDNDTGNGKVINARGGRVRVNGKFMRIKTN